MKKRRTLFGKLIWLLPAAMWLWVLFYFSGQSGDESGALSGRLAEALLRHMPFLNVSQETFNHVLRKLAHFGIFAVEGFLVRIGLAGARPEGRGNLIISVILCGIVAVLNELHQLTAAGRACMPQDMLLDAFGAAVGALFALMVECTVHELRRRRRRRLDRKARV